MEIDASNAKYKWFGSSDHAPLSALLDFPELYATFPQLADLPVRKSDHSDFTHAFGGEIAFREATNYILWNDMRLKARDERDNLADLIHEVQHAVQNIENPGNPGTEGRTHAEYYNHPKEVQARDAAARMVIIIKP
ncbi:MAG: hypothetical protein PHY29_02760 [Syntrophales bacterium]|nr:hypothetical protein [Syntrophales bacterium]